MAHSNRQDWNADIRMYLSYEGVLGMEQGGNCKPANSIYLPFMRNAVGPMDFTPGSMLSAQPEDNRSTRANAMGSGTRAYQMALFVVFESGLTDVCRQSCVLLP